MAPVKIRKGRYIIHLLILVVLFMVVPVSPSFGKELKTNYATIIYDREEQLLRFNERVPFGDSSYRLKNVKIGTVGNEVRNKLDAIVEKAEMILNLFPKELKFNVRLLDKEIDVWGSYKVRYGIGAHHIAFYSPQNKTIYISVDDVSLGLLAHELAHAIIDQYYCTYNSCMLIPIALHEALAQLVEYRIES